MKKHSFVGLAALAAVVMAAAPGRAQLFTPPFQSTERGSDIGLYLSDGPGDLAVEGIWRRGLGTGDLGLRLGFADAQATVTVLSESAKPACSADGATTDFGPASPREVWGLSRVERPLN